MRWMLATVLLLLGLALAGPTDAEASSGCDGVVSGCAPSLEPDCHGDPSHPYCYASDTVEWCPGPWALHCGCVPDALPGRAGHCPGYADAARARGRHGEAGGAHGSGGPPGGSGGSEPGEGGRGSAGAGAGGDGAGEGVPPAPTCTPVAAVHLPPDPRLAALPSGSIGLDPAVRSVTGMPTHAWWHGPTVHAWTQPGRPGLREDCSIVPAPLTPYTAAAVGWRFDFGDDAVPATHPSAVPGSPDDPATTHVYERKGARTVRVEVTWRAAGFTFTTAATRDHGVAEVRTRLTPP